MFVPPPPPDPREEPRLAARPSSRQPEPVGSEDGDPEPQAPGGRGPHFGPLSALVGSVAGAEGMSGGELAEELQRGGRLVVYQYCVSLLLVTFLQTSGVHLIRAGESPGRYGGRFSLLSLLFGWWGFPWGPIRTLQALATNGRGIDVTQEVLANFGVGAGQRRREPARGKSRRAGDAAAAMATATGNERRVTLLPQEAPGREGEVTRQPGRGGRFGLFRVEWVGSKR
jgi:hypothetical protein